MSETQTMPDTVEETTQTTEQRRAARQETYDRVGREQLGALLEYGLNPDSYVLDIGCGKLRCGRWVIPLLEPGHYCGIEPVPNRVEIGLKRNVPDEIIELKKPRFDHNADFDFSVFDTKFTHIVARSIWSHASKRQIEQMLDGMAAWAAPGAVFLASFRPTTRGRKNDYMGDEWKGRSHESGEPGIVAHSVEWIDEACSARGLIYELSTRPPVKKNGQVWAVIHKPESPQDPGTPGTPGTAAARHDARAARAQRQLMHGLQVVNLAVRKYADATEKSDRDFNTAKARKAIKALQRDTRRLTKEIGIDTKEVLGS